MSAVPSRTVLLAVLLMALGSCLDALPRQSVVRDVLPNGLRLIVAARPGTPLVALDLWVRAGSGHELDSHPGVAHFLEHMAFRGAGARTSSQLDMDAESLGGVLNAGTTRAGAHYHISVPAAHLAEALRLLSDVVVRPTLPEEGMERERQVILDELARMENSVDARLTDALVAQLFPNHAVGRSLLGLRQSVRVMRREDIVSFRARTYHPRNAVLAIAGATDVEGARAAAAEAFGTWAAAGESMDAMPAIPARPPELPEAAWETARGQVAAGAALALPISEPGDYDVVSLLPYLLRQRLSAGQEEAMSLRLERLPNHEVLFATVAGAPETCRAQIGAWKSALEELAGRGPDGEDLAAAATERTRDRLAVLETAEGLARLLAEEELLERQADAERKTGATQRPNGRRLQEILAESLRSGWLAATLVPKAGSPR